MSQTTNRNQDLRSTRQAIDLFGVTIDAVSMADAVEIVASWIDQPGFDCSFVVTPNTDHAVMLQNNQPLRDAYAAAGLVLADGWPIVLASRLVRQPLPERVAGSDLVPRLFDHFQSRERKLRVFLLGAADGVGLRAARHMKIHWPYVDTVGVYSPPMGFEHDEKECERIIRRINDSEPDLLVVGLGAPKQELWVHRHHGQLRAKSALCVGATIDFLAGNKHRAPVWMQRTGTEWLHRMLSEPRRLAGRYAKDAIVFPGLVVKQWRGRCR